MNVKCAKDHMYKMTDVCDKINKFSENHAELNEETGFLCDAVAFLCDYRKVLERAIEKAELQL